MTVSVSNYKRPCLTAKKSTKMLLFYLRLVKYCWTELLNFYANVNLFRIENTLFLYLSRIMNFKINKNASSPLFLLLYLGKAR